MSRIYGKQNVCPLRDSITLHFEYSLIRLAIVVAFCGVHYVSVAVLLLLSSSSSLFWFRFFFLDLFQQRYVRCIIVLWCMFPHRLMYAFTHPFSLYVVGLIVYAFVDYYFFFYFFVGFYSCFSLFISVVYSIVYMYYTNSFDVHRQFHFV